MYSAAKIGCGINDVAGNQWLVMADIQRRNISNISPIQGWLSLQLFQ